MVIAATALVLAPFGLDAYSLNIFAQAFIFAIVAITVDLLWGYSGILSYAQSAFFGIGAYSIGLSLAHVGASVPAALASVVIGLVIAAAAAFVVGALSFHPKASWLFIAVVTFAIPVVFEQLVLSGGSFTGSSSGLSGFPTLGLTFTEWFLLAGAVLILTVTLAYRLVTSDAGRVLHAIRENEERCQYLGLETSTIKIVLFAGCAVVAGGAGMMYALFADVVAPNLGNFVLGTQFVIWVALGGRGTIVGPVIATIFVNVATAQLASSFPFIWQLFIGVLFVVVVMYLPQGFLPAALQVLHTVGRRSGRRLAQSIRADVDLPGGAHDAPNVVRPGVGRVSGVRLASAERPTALHLVGVTKSFGSLRVLNGIDLDVKAGELMSIVGPNGAGKTTLIKCISDGTDRSSGAVVINGHDAGHQAPPRLVRYGLCRKFQAANVFNGLTVRDCLLLAASSRRRPSLWRTTRQLALPEAAHRVVSVTGLDQLLDSKASSLGHGQKQALELAMVLAVEPTVVLLDEPTAGLTHRERAAVGQILTELAANHNLCIVLVEHDLEFVKQISSRVVVLHQGRILLDGTVREVVDSQLVREIYTGVGA